MDNTPYHSILLQKIPTKFGVKDSAWKIIKSTILQAPEEALGKIGKNINKVRSYKTPWFPPSLKEITLKKKLAF